MSEFKFIEWKLKELQVECAERAKSRYITSTDRRDLLILEDRLGCLYRFLCRHEDLPDYFPDIDYEQHLNPRKPLYEL